MPKSKRNSILSEIYDSIGEAAHFGYHRTSILDSESLGVQLIVLEMGI